jgi:hypothetical protein
MRLGFGWVAYSMPLLNSLQVICLTVLACKKVDHIVTETMSFWLIKSQVY